MTRKELIEQILSIITEYFPYSKKTRSLARAIVDRLEFDIDLIGK